MDKSIFFIGKKNSPYIKLKPYRLQKPVQIEEIKSILEQTLKGTVLPLNQPFESLRYSLKTSKKKPWSSISGLCCKARHVRRMWQKCAS